MDGSKKNRGCGTGVYIGSILENVLIMKEISESKSAKDNQQGGWL